MQIREEENHVIYIFFLIFPPLFNIIPILTDFLTYAKSNHFFLYISTWKDTVKVHDQCIILISKFYSELHNLFFDNIHIIVNLFVMETYMSYAMNQSAAVNSLFLQVVPDVIIGVLYGYA